MAYDYDVFCYALKEMFKYSKKSLSIKPIVDIRDTIDYRRTISPFDSKEKHAIIQFGVLNEKNSIDGISFTDVVKGIIDVGHESMHVKQFETIRKSKNVSFMFIDHISHVKNKDYYFATYYESVSEIDAELAGMRLSRKYWYNKYPMYKQEIDNHILYWGEKWFSRILDKLDCSSLDTFLESGDNYLEKLYSVQSVFSYGEEIKNSGDLVAKHIVENKVNNRYMHMDDKFLNAKNGILQRYASAEIVMYEIPNYVKYNKCLKNYVNLNNIEQRQLPSISDNIEDDIESELE